MQYSHKCSNPKTPLEACALHSGSGTVLLRHFAAPTSWTWSPARRGAARQLELQEGWKDCSQPKDEKKWSGEI